MSLGMLPLRNMCECGSVTGELRPNNGSNDVYCIVCKKYCFCARKDELDSTVEPRNDRIKKFKPKQKARILLRDSGRCILCGTNEDVLHIGHLISVKDGPQLGLSDDDLWSDENLATMCSECNLGLGADSVTARLIAALVRRGTL